MDYTIIGSEVNLAERLESIAELGGILIGHETYSLVKDYIHVDEQTPKIVKGFTKPIRNYSVTGFKQSPMSESTPITLSLCGVEIVLDAAAMSNSDQKKIIETLKNTIQHLTGENPTKFSD